MADSGEFSQLMKQLEGMMGGAAAMQVVQQAISAYDQVAVAAMQSLIALGTLGTYEDLAAAAWKIADAMVAERAKRGLGNAATSKPNDPEVEDGSVP